MANKAGKELLDGLSIGESKIEVIKRFNGTTDAAKVYLEIFADMSALSRDAKDVLKAMSQILGHGPCGWYACPREREKKIIKACLRLSNKNYEEALDEICNMKYFKRNKDGGINIDNELIPTYKKGCNLERFAVSAHEGRFDIKTQAELISYEETENEHECAICHTSIESKTEFVDSDEQ